MWVSRENAGRIAASRPEFSTLVVVAIRRVSGFDPQPAKTAIQAMTTAGARPRNIVENIAPGVRPPEEPSVSVMMRESPCGFGAAGDRARARPDLSRSRAAP